MDRRAIAAIERLPESARSKLRDLEFARGAAQDAASSATNRLATLPRDADPQMAARLSDERDKQARRAAALSALGNRLHQYLAELRPGIELEVAPPISLELKPGEKLTDAIENARAAIKDVVARLDATRRATLPLADQKKLAEDYTVRLMRQGRPQIAVVADKLSLKFRGDLFAPEDTLSLMAWAMPDLVCDAIERELSQQPERADALSRAERIKRVSELEAQLLELERREEKLIELASADGHDVLRRSDANPLCVLGLAIKQEARQVA